jgi:putative FmdB family regulatory protein
MPIYEFECTSCGTVFERLQKLSDADPTECPNCHQESVKRRLTAPAFRLAGSGWYESDFKKEGDKKRNLAGNDDAPAAKTDAKPDAKETTKEAPKETPKSDKAPAATPAPKPKDSAADT